jgi:hypothetical protein
MIKFGMDQNLGPSTGRLGESVACGGGGERQGQVLDSRLLKA